jgi:hypothetical protein
VVEEVMAAKVAVPEAVMKCRRFIICAGDITKAPSRCHVASRLVSSAEFHSISIFGN